jgi:hypothetical protein
MNIYYAIWTDALLKLKSHPKNEGMWKFYAFVFISFGMTINLMVLMSILQRHIFQQQFYNIPQNILPDSPLNSALRFILLFLAPPILINYFLIFRKRQYEVLFQRYKHRNGRLFASYIIISYFSPIVLLRIALLWTECF